MADVNYSDTRVYSVSQITNANMAAVQTVSRGTGHAAQLFTETASTMTISTGRDLALIVDLGDEAQSPWTKGAELFDRIGALLNEFIESSFLGQFASWTDFGVGDLNSVGPVADTAQITVTASNIDDMIRGFKRVFRTANGQMLMNDNGVGVVWRAQDFEYLEAFVQANGFATADAALKEGTVEGLRYMGVDHYWSNDHTANHVVAGVKKTHMIGVLRSLYGKPFTIPFPAADSNMFFSGTAYYSRVDIGHLIPTVWTPLMLDVNVV